MEEKDQKALLEKVTAEVKDQLKEFVSKNDLTLALTQATEKIKDEFKGVDGMQKAIDELRKAAETQGELLAKMKDNTKSEPLTIKQQLEANGDILRSLARVKSQVEMNNYIGKTTVIPSAITSNFNGYVIPGIGQIQTRRNSLRATVNNAGIPANSQLTIRYMDQTTFTDASAARTIGQAAAESTIAWTGYNLGIEQISHMIPVALEMLENFDFVENEIRTNLLKYLDLKVEYYLLNGTGSTPQISGVLGATKYTAYSAPTGLANNVKYPGILDVIMVASAQIQNNSLYQPNYVWMNNYDAMALKLDKDEFGQLKFPNFLSANGMDIDGIRIVPSSLITANTMFVGDFTYDTLYGGGAQITVGTNSDDFSKRKVTLLANEPIANLVKALNTAAIVYVSDINAAIAGLTKGA